MRSIYEIVAGLEQRGIEAALCIITETHGSTPLKEGAKMVVCRNKKMFGTIGGGNLEKQVIEDALAVMESGKPEIFEHQLVRDHQMCCGGSVFVFIEPVRKRNKLIVFGAGHVGKEVVRLSQSLNFQISLVDERSEMLNGLEWGDAKIFNMHHNEFLSNVVFDVNTFIVICTHLHHYDREILAQCIKQPSAYLGMIGSMRKVVVTRKTFIKQEWASEEELSKVDMPMGFNIGGNSPAEIAISIVAKLVAVMNGRILKINNEEKISYTYAGQDRDNNRCW